DGTLAAYSRARTSAGPASKAVLKSSRFRGREEYGSASQLGQNPVVLWSSTRFPLRPPKPDICDAHRRSPEDPAQRRAPPGWKFAPQSSLGRPRSRLLLIAQAAADFASTPRVFSSYRFSARVIKRGRPPVGPSRGAVVPLRPARALRPGADSPARRQRAPPAKFDTTKRRNRECRSERCRQHRRGPF